MNYFLVSIFIFYIGSSMGWIFELILRRILHKRWVNPGFLVGPYLPIYGVGLFVLTIIHNIADQFRISQALGIIISGISMTLIELVTGLFFLHQGIRLWDYRDRKFNYKGVICPLFSFVWLLAGVLYYFVVEEKLVMGLRWFSQNLSFSYTLGMFSGFVIIDVVYSTKMYKKIREFARNNNISIIYEKLKEHIKEMQKSASEKYSFMLPLKFGKLNEHLVAYKEKIMNR